MWSDAGADLGWRLPRVSVKGQEEGQAEDGEEVVEGMRSQEKGGREGPRAEGKGPTSSEEEQGCVHGGDMGSLAG